MGQDVNAEERLAKARAEEPFVQASIDARNRELRAAGHVFVGCFREEQHNHAWDGSVQELRAREAEGARLAAEWQKQFEHGPDEGRCFVGCGHRVDGGSGMRSIKRG